MSAPLYIGTIIIIKFLLARKKSRKQNVYVLFNMTILLARYLMRFLMRNDTRNSATGTLYATSLARYLVRNLVRNDTTGTSL